MSNGITDLVLPIMAKGLKKLRRNAGIIPLVNRGYETDFKEKGETVRVTVGSAKTVSDVTPSMTFPTPADSTLAKIDITLSKWRGTSAHIRDDEVQKFDASKDFIPGAIDECISPIIDEIHDHVAAQYTGVYGIVGTAGTTPFASNLDVLVDAHTVLRDQRAPKDARAALIDIAAEGKLLKLAALQEAQKAGDSRTLREGQMGRLLRFDMDSADVMPYHTSTPFTAGACTVNGVQAAGVGSTDNLQTGTLSIAKATNAAPVVAGDILEFTVGGVVQQHTVVTGVTLAVGNTSVTVAPALRVATAGGETVTLRASHRVNLAFHRDAFALAMVPAKEFTVGGDAASRMVFSQMVQDPVSGIAIRVQVVRGYHMTAWYFDALWGSKLVRPALACRIAG